ncbi:DUF7448 domain-containing protein [Bacillus altitudinis]|uniref:DUF7448 domain-containing protein n=1 Tax=Bacillus altitudinis TaxID=293387 RepID=UPI000FF8EBCE|nr:hypothetical protein [Bacillus altitudinis]MBG9901835.1 hypothetical protein [Bacillus altitudinis]QAR52064.1 hypothetical protein BAE_04315 [Bacillus aerophilus]UTV31989.1 hypothetical protein NM966_14555 [Bacillus altitudinis]
MSAIDAEVSDLLGKTLVEVSQSGEDALFFSTECGKEYRMYHYQNCCEDVHINDICGDLSDLIGHPLLMSEEVSSEEDPPEEDHHGSYTWTFYKFATIKGDVTIRWFGSSNGHYSESVDFELLEESQ